MSRNRRTRNQARAARNAAKAKTWRPSRNPKPPQIRKHRMERELRDAKDRTNIDSTLDGITPANRPVVEEWVDWQVRQKHRLSSVATKLRTVARIDLFTNGTRWRSLLRDPTPVGDYFLERSRKVLQGTAQQESIAFRQMMREFVNDGNKLPRPFLRATASGRPKRLNRKRVISQDAFQLLLDAAPDLMWQAVYLVFCEVGFRNQELCSLNVGSFAPGPDGKSADLALPESKDARFFLKTGPRTCAAVRCVPAVRAWLELHPFRDDPDAPLFVVKGNQHDSGYWLPLSPDRVYRQLAKDRRFAGAAHFTPHDFRHTAATNRAKMDPPWTPAQANGYFGWSPGSTMWTETYVHLASQDLTDRVRRDHGLNALGQSNHGLKNCPWCAEPIKTAALVCKHCQRDAEAAVQPHARSASTPDR